MKKFILPAFLAFAFVACNNNTATDRQPINDSDKKDSVVTQNPNEGPGAGSAAGNSNVSATGLDTAAVGTNPKKGNDSTTVK